MLGMDFFSVVIGLFALYIVFSVVCTVIVEGIIAWFAVREQSLETSLRNFFGFESVGNTTFLKAFFNHGAIKSLTIGGTGRPSKISPKLFSEVVISIVEEFDMKGDVYVGPDNSSKTDAGNDFKNILRFFAKGTKNEQEFKSKLEMHYNAILDCSAERLNRYKRNLALMVSMLIVVLCNIDTLALVKELSSTQDSGTNFVRVAEQQIKAADLLLKIYKVDTKKQDSIRNQAINIISDAASSLLVASTISKKSQIGIGWDTFPTDTNGILTKIAGLLVSILAISLGFSFWLSVLKALMQSKSEEKK